MRAFLIAPAREDFINRPEDVRERDRAVHSENLQISQVLLFELLIMIDNVNDTSTEVEEFEILPERIQDLTKYALSMNGTYTMDFSVTKEKT